MSTPEANLLGTLRRRRRGIAAALLPALLAWLATGSACVTMTHGAAPHADHVVHESHAGHHTSHHSAPQPVSPDAPCAHCPAGGTAAVAAHACAPTDGTAALAATPLPDAKPLLLAVDWVPLPSTPAPPLIRFATLPPGALPAHVPLNILHCVLLI